MYAEAAFSRNDLEVLSEVWRSDKAIRERRAMKYAAESAAETPYSALETGKEYVANAARNGYAAAGTRLKGSLAVPVNYAKQELSTPYGRFAAAAGAINEISAAVAGIAAWQLTGEPRAYVAGSRVWGNLGPSHIVDLAVYGKEYWKDFESEDAPKLTEKGFADRAAHFAKYWWHEKKNVPKFAWTFAKYKVPIFLMTRPQSAVSAIGAGYLIQGDMPFIGADIPLIEGGITPIVADNMGNLVFAGLYPAKKEFHNNMVHDPRKRKPPEMTPEEQYLHQAYQAIALDLRFAQVEASKSMYSM